MGQFEVMFFGWWLLIGCMSALAAEPMFEAAGFDLGAWGLARQTWVIVLLTLGGQGVLLVFMIYLYTERLQGGDDGNKE